MEQYQNHERALTHMAFINRENQRRHHRYEEEMHMYELMRAGDFAGVAQEAQRFSSDLNGRISEDPLRNVKYTFVASATLVTRFAIEGGMDSETAYNNSDLFINRADRCGTIAELNALHTEMFRYFTERMAQIKKNAARSKPVTLCLDEIDLHLHEAIRLPDLAAHIGINPQYLSALFHKEMGVTLTEYILRRRLEAAQNMLKFSDYTCVQIAAFLGFGSQSYFIRLFKREVGMTPREYRRRHFRISLTQER
ncbi:MAG: helix-turn-helix domain-containing protein [Eubacteriales bacterium]|nr:helix-turn-helix domain-containing protein [Eubacteriales bacterium]